MTNVERLLAVFHQDPALWETIEGWNTIRARLRAEVEVWDISEREHREAWDSFMEAMRKPTLPEVVPRFQRYHAAHPAWGVFHTVLDDGNHADCHVDYCIEVAQEQGDEETIALAHLLRRLSRTQRGKLARVACMWPTTSAG